jgi:hypothetical protein
MIAMPAEPARVKSGTPFTSRVTTRISRRVMRTHQARHYGSRYTCLHRHDPPALCHPRTSSRCTAQDLLSSVGSCRFQCRQITIVFHHSPTVTRGAAPCAALNIANTSTCRSRSSSGARPILRTFELTQRDLF